VRLVAASLLLAAGAAFAAPAPAQVSLPPLAQGEVVLQTIGLGQVTTPADRALLRLQVTARGTDDAGAGRALRARLDRIRAALRAAGVADADAEAGAIAVTRDEEAAASRRALTESMGVGWTSSPTLAFGWPTVTVTVPLVLLVRDPAGLPAVREALVANEVSVPQPEYFIANDGPQRWQAREQAVRRARADAETQAALLNMRIVRVRRISERTGPDMPGLMANEVPTMLRQIASIWRGVQAPEVETMMAVGVDFALAPR
jgi:uncharacterized protein YggE